MALDDLAFGTRNKRGDWAPNAPCTVAPFWVRPLNLGAILRWIPGFLWPWNALHMATALLWWHFIVPDVQTLRTLSFGWIALLLGANWLGCLVFYGFFEWRFYRRRVQGHQFRYHHKFPAEQPSEVFWFKSQNLDNFLRTFCFSIPLWTLVQVIVLWNYAHGTVSWLSWADHPLYLAALVLLAPAIHEVHFFCIHRLIHTPFLYRWVHSVHHNSVNASPWSSLSMHPVEGFLYHAVALWHLVIPSNPIVAMFQLHMAGFGAINGHIGFEKVRLPGGALLNSHAYAHYLHHKYFEVNYGGDGLIPLDLWFGSWHDGTREGDRRMQERHQRKMARLNAAREGRPPGA